jgi:hypothetical protein
MRIAFLLLFAACATGIPNIPTPEVDVAQEVGPAELSYPTGMVEFKYAFRIANQWSQPMTLIRVDVRTVNPAGGAYALEPRTYNFHETIPAGATKIVELWAHANAYGRGPRDAEPVSLRLVMHFDTPAGGYQTVVMREMPQM